MYRKGIPDGGGIIDTRSANVSIARFTPQHLYSAPSCINVCKGGKAEVISDRRKGPSLTLSGHSSLGCLFGFSVQLIDQRVFIFSMGSLSFAELLCLRQSTDILFTDGDTMTDTIETWLENIGLGLFADSFRENGIDLTNLQELDNNDLKDLGVTRLIDRKTILKAIATLKVSIEREDRLPDQNVQADRRQLTVMFCDLVASTELSARLDPEDMREVLKSYQETVTGAILQHDGYVANYLGDGVLAYFGWPSANEDQAANSVRAGLKAAKAVGEIQTSSDDILAARVGIATGQVVVGDLETETGRQSAVISGETPNRAARIQAEAEPSQTCIDDTTRLLLGAGFDFVNLGERLLKGLANAEQIWAVAGESMVESRFAAQHSGSLTPYIGREDDIATVMAGWQQCLNGNGQTIALCGEAGIGKSRLLQMARDVTNPEDHTVLQFQCSPFYTNTALYPFAQQLAFAAGFENSDTDEQKLEKLEAITAASDRSMEETYAILASLLQLPIGKRYPSLRYSPDRLLQETGAVLIEQMHTLSRSRPVLMLVEDLHWSDQYTLAIINQINEAVADWPILLILTYRPEFEAPWTDGDQVHVLELRRLERDHCRALIQEVLRTSELPKAVVEQILDKTDGVPLFVEELVKSVLESEVASDGVAKSDRKWLSIAIPSTLQDSLIARLDRLSPVREIAQYAAVLGRDFSYALIAEISPMGENELRDGLQQLVNAELIFRQGQQPNETYQFKHALVRDTAYDGILRVRRRQMHKAVAEAIGRQRPNAMQTEAELLAQHYEAADLPLSAIPLWTAASQVASSRAAYGDALQHAERGINLLRSLNREDQRAEWEIALLSARAMAVMPGNGYGDERVLEAFNRISELSANMEDAPELLGSLFWVSVGFWNKGDILAAVEYVDRILRIADASGDLTTRVAVRGYTGSLLVHLPDFKRSQEHLSFVLENYDPSMHQDICQIAGQDLGINGYNWQSIRLAMEGFADQGLKLATRAVDISRQQDHPFSFPLVLIMACWTAHICREPLKAKRWYEEGVAYCEANENYFWLEFLKVDLAYQYLLHGSYDCDSHILEARLEFVEQTGVRLFAVVTMATLALKYQADGNQEQSDTLLDRCASQLEAMPDYLSALYFHQLRGEIYELRGLLQEAVQEYQTLVEMGNIEGAKLFQLRGASRLANLAETKNQKCEARDLLSPLYDWFTEGQELPDLLDARAALKRLD